jgi:hypothetical protein
MSSTCMIRGKRRIYKYQFLYVSAILVGVGKRGRSMMVHYMRLSQLDEHFCGASIVRSVVLSLVPLLCRRQAVLWTIH